MFCINLSIHSLTIPSVICVSILLSRLEELRLIYSFGCCLIQVNFAGFFIRPKSDHCLPVSLTDWLTDSLTNVFETWLIWPWRVKMPTQNLLMLLLFLILMMWIVLAAVCCSFGSWGLVIKLNFFSSDFEHAFVYRTLQRFGQYFEVEVQARFLSWNLVSI